MAVLRQNDGTRWDWDKGMASAGLGTCFPRRITFGDVDGEIEINGHYLVIEGKRMGQSITGGQKYTMDARVRDGRTVFVAYGDPPTDIREIQFWPMPERFPATWQTFWEACREWADHVAQLPRPEPRTSYFFPTFIVPQSDPFPATRSGSSWTRSTPALSRAASNS